MQQADLAVDFSEEIEGFGVVYALTFHPEFERNRYCYVCYIVPQKVKDGTRIARFKVADTDPPTIDAVSEETIITWVPGGHNG